VDEETGESAATWLDQGRISTDTGALFTGSEGSVTVFGLPEGRYRVLAVGQERRVELLPGEPPTCSIQRVE
jgi:hypothetical protein